MQSKLKFALTIAVISLVPMLTFAQGLTAESFLRTKVQPVLALIIPILVAFALIVFIWNLVKFIGNAGDESAREEGKKGMWWGILALFIIVSIWGIIRFVGRAVGITESDSSSAIRGPALPTQ